MRVIYFEIQDCKFEFIDGKPAIIAPEDIDEERLREYSFIQLLDGRWCHFMADYEINYYMNSGDIDVLIFPPPNAYQYQNIVKRNEEKDICITLVLIIIFCIGIIVLSYSYKISLIIMAASCLGLFISSMLHNSSAAKALIVIIIIIHILLLLMVVMVVYVIGSLFGAFVGCGNEAWDTCQVIGEMGAQYTYFWE